MSAFDDVLRRLDPSGVIEVRYEQILDRRTGTHLDYRAFMEVLYERDVLRDGPCTGESCAHTRDCIFCMQPIGANKNVCQTCMRESRKQIEARTMQAFREKFEKINREFDEGVITHAGFRAALMALFGENRVGVFDDESDPAIDLRPCG